MDLDRSVWAPFSLQHVTPHARRVAPRGQGSVLSARGYHRPPARGSTRVGAPQEPRKLISRWHSEWHSDAPSAIDQSQRDASRRISYFTFNFSGVVGTRKHISHLRLPAPGHWKTFWVNNTQEFIQSLENVLGK